MFNFDDRKKYIEDVKKAVEVGLLKAQFLYSTVIERPLEEKDFDVMTDEKNKLGSYIIKYFYCRVYLNLTHEEQKFLIESAYKESTEVSKNVDSWFKAIGDKIDELEEKLKDCNDEKEIFMSVGELFNFILNMFKGLFYDKIDKIPPELFKKLFLNLFKDDFDVSPLIELYIEEMENQTLKQIDELSKLPLQDLHQRLAKALEIGDMKAYLILSQALVKKENDDTEK